MKQVQTWKPDLVLLDVHFSPDVSHGGGVPWDGFILMRWLIGMQQSRRIPVIFTTGCSGPGLKERAQASGALGLFEKPIDHGRLIDLIQRVFSGEATSEFDTSFQQ